MTKKRLLFLVLLSSFFIPAQAATIKEARKLYHAGKLNSALAQTDELLQANSQSIPALFLKAQIESESKDLDDAINTYRAIILIEPDHLQAYNNLAALYAQQGKLKEAADTLETAIGTDTVFMTIHTNLRAIYMDMSQKHYRQALKLDTESNPTLIASIDIDDSSEQILQEEAQIVPNSIQDAINTTVAKNPPPKRKTAPTKQAARPAAEPKPVGATKRQDSAAPKKAAKTATPAAKTPKSSSVVPPSPDDKKVAGAEKDHSADVKKATLAWAKAWSDRDVNRYTRAYVSNYATFGRSHKDWVAGRNWNFKNKKYIRVSLSDIRIEPRGKQYRVRFTQKYESDTYQDTVKKELQFVSQGGKWRIAKEESS